MTSPIYKRAAESVGIYEAKNRFSELVDRVAEGEEVVITKHGKPVARLVPADEVPVDPQQVQAALDELRRLGREAGFDLTLDEIRDAIREGRV